MSDHTDPLFKSLLILNFDNLMIYSKLSFMHSICYNYAPPSYANTFPIYIHDNYNLRTRAKYEIPHHRIELFKRFPLYSFPVTWNAAGDVTFHSNRITFQIALKDLLINDLYDAQRLYRIP